MAFIRVVSDCRCRDAFCRYRLPAERKGRPGFGKNLSGGLYSGFCTGGRGSSHKICVLDYQAQADCFVIALFHNSMGDFYRANTFKIKAPESSRRWFRGLYFEVMRYIGERKNALFIYNARRVFMWKGIFTWYFTNSNNTIILKVNCMLEITK